MQIIPFPAHYQSVYTNFDISSFSLISCVAEPTLLQRKTAAFAMQNNRFRNALVANKLHDRYACEKYLQPYCCLFAHKMSYIS